MPSEIRWSEHEKERKYKSSNSCLIKLRSQTHSSKMYIRVFYKRMIKNNKHLKLLKYMQTTHRQPLYGHFGITHLGIDFGLSPCLISHFQNVIKRKNVFMENNRPNMTSDKGQSKNFTMRKQACEH